ncbi:MAG: HEAT repeat domain-containing protein [bacterium]
MTEPLEHSKPPGSEEEIEKKLLQLSESGTFAQLKQAIGFTGHSSRKIKILAVKASSAIIKRNLITDFEKLDANVKNSLALLLKRLDPAIIDSISDDLFSESEDHRLRALKVLGLLGQSIKIKQVLQKMLLDKDTKIRATAISLLNNMVNSEDIRIIVKVLHDNDSRVRANAVEVLEKIQSPNVISLLAKNRNDPDNRIRGNVIKALWCLGDKTVIKDIKEMLLHESHLMRASGAWILGEIGKDHRELIDLLARHALDEHRLVRDNVIKSFLKIASKEAHAYLGYLFEKTDVDKVVNIKKN